VSNKESNIWNLVYYRGILLIEVLNDSLLFYSPRRVRQLSLEGCSLLTVEGLESVILSWKDLQRLRVVSCNKIMDSAVTPALATLFSVLKELKWSPDSRSLLSSSLAETDLRKKGGRFFRSYKG